MAANNTMGKAVLLGGVDSGLGGQKIGYSGEAAWYKFRLNQTGTYRDRVGIIFSHFLGDLRLDVYNSAGKHVGYADSSRNDPSSKNPDLETFRFEGFAAGDYYVKVSGNNGATNTYGIAWELPSNLAPDRYENNSTFATATKLAAYGSQPGLSIHDGNDLDYFKFHLDRTGTDADYLKISFRSAFGDLDINLYDSLGKNAGMSNSWDNDEEIISLKGKKPGDYYLKVRTGWNSPSETNQYTLDWKLPSSVIPKKDAYENNNTRAAAALLKGESGTLSGLTHHTASDQDWFKFTLTRPGSSSQLITAGGDANVSLRLYDSAGKFVRDLSSKPNLAGMKAGTYYVLASNKAGESTLSYSLSWKLLPPKDAYEGAKGNNSRQTATVLAAKSGTLSNLTHHTASDQDWFKFTLTGAGLSSDLITAGGDKNVSLRLYDSAGKFVRDLSSKPNLAGMKAGTYYVLASNKAGKTTHSYSLSWKLLPPKDAYEGAKGNNTRQTATTLAAKSGTLKSLTLHTASDKDWFKFTIGVPGRSTDTISASGDKNVSLRLYDSAGKFVRDLSSRPNLAGLKAGTYYAMAYSAAGKTSESYTLSWNFLPPKDSYENNNTRGTAKSLLGETGTIANLTHHTASDQDWFKFTLSRKGESSDRITASGDANVSLRLYNASGKFVRNLSSVSHLAGLHAGTYYVLASNKAGKTTDSYSLSWALNPPKDIYDSGKGINNDTPAKAVLLKAQSGTVSGLTHHTASDLDVFKVVLNRSGKSSDVISVAGDSNVYLSRPDSSGTSFTSSGGKSVSLSGLKPGTYYVTAFNGAGKTTASYSLSWNFNPPKDIFEANDSIAKATPLYVKEGKITGLTHHSKTDADYFRITLSKNGGSSDKITISGDSAVYLRLYNSSGAQVKGAAKVLSLSGLSAGTYYAKAYNAKGQTTDSYDLSWSFANGYPSDDFENNNSFQTATPLPVKPCYYQHISGTIHNAADVDYYKLHLDKRGTADDYLSMYPVTATQADMALYNAKGGLVASSSNTGLQLDKISLNGMAAGDYYLKIYGTPHRYGSGSYSLTWSLPSSSLVATTLAGGGISAS